jgi:adenine phosphoribosyltransferase
LIAVFCDGPRSVVLRPFSIERQSDPALSVLFTAEQLRDAVRNVPNFPSPGIQFKDITPILSDRELLMQSVDALADPYLDAGITKVLGIEARGFILGGMLARRLGAGFIPIRKKGKLPHDILKVEYELEYGTDCIEMHADALDASDIVLIHDDVIATGGTAAAAGRLARETGAQIAGFAFLIELEFLTGRKVLEHGARVHSVLRYQ